jgi:hypothetical protein
MSWSIMIDSDGYVMRRSRRLTKSPKIMFRKDWLIQQHTNINIKSFPKKYVGKRMMLRLQEMKYSINDKDSRLNLLNDLFHSLIDLDSQIPLTDFESKRLVYDLNDNIVQLKKRLEVKR